MSLIFPKNFSERFIHVGYSAPSVPGPWVPHVEACLVGIEKLMWPRWLPMWSKRAINYLATGNSLVRVRSHFWYKVRTRLTRGAMIRQIKDKFASVRIYGSFSGEMQDLIRVCEEKCARTCENCGHQGDDVKQVGYNWVYRLCKNCANDSI